MQARIDTQAIKEQVDMREQASQYTQLKRVTSAGDELAGPCPLCGGTDRFHVTSEWFFCRRCHPQRGDAIEFVRWLHGVGFAEAVAMLDFGVVRSSPPAQTKPVAKPKPERKVQPNEWLQEASLEVEQAYYRLWLPAGEPGRNYLCRRALEAHVWGAYHLGYRADAPVPGTEGRQRAPAIVLPWYREGQIVAMRYRFLEPQGTHRLTSKAGSTFTGLLFGGQALEFGPEDAAVLFLRTLVLCEGEINAMSVWQVARETNVDVLSLGSESAQLTPVMIAFAASYGHVLCWLDRPQVADAVAGALPGSHRIASPSGKDANDWLREGLLGGLLSTARLRLCKGALDRERLLWDVWDAADSVQGVDGGTAQVIERLAGELGKKVRLYQPVVEVDRWITRRG